MWFRSRSYEEEVTGSCSAGSKMEAGCGIAYRDAERKQAPRESKKAERQIPRQLTAVLRRRKPGRLT